MTDAQRNESLEAADLSALSWCIGEIRESLAACERELRACRQEGEGAATGSPKLAAARSALHQAHGALSIVDLAGVTTVTGEAEAVLERVARGQLGLDDAMLDALARSFAAILEYLDELVLGEPQQPLYLFPYYESLLRLREAERIHPADLFVVPVRAQLVVAHDAARTLGAAELNAARVAFERGLLSVLRDPLDSAGLAALHASVATIGGSQIGAAHPTFWKVALAYFEALRDGALSLDVYGKRLLARLNLQLRRSMADGALVADRLLKDTLFALAGADEARSAGSPLVAEVRRAFGLAGSVPPDFATPRFGRIDAKAVQAAKEAIARAKLAWEKLCAGNAGELASFAQAIAALRSATAKLPFPGVQALADAFGEASRVLALGSPMPSEALAIEVASALLFAEQIFERGLKGRDDHDARAGEMAERVLQCCAGRPPVDEMPRWLGDISRAAQERLTMSTFIAEVQDNLRSVEQTLDAFFRDASQRADLAATAQRLRQVAGALGVLGHEDAASAAKASAARVDEFAHAHDVPAAETCRNVADSIGALGFFVERLQQANRSGARFAFDAESGRFDAVLDEARADPRTAVVQLDATAESLLAQHTRQALELVATLAERPSDAGLRDALRRTLAKVRDDAHFADDTVLKAHAGEAMACLDASAADDVSGLRVAVAKLAGEPAPAAAAIPTPEPPRSDDDVDRELLEIFLGEAQEVLAAIAEASAGSRAAPQDVALLTTMRRGFHTLKGSSRMVGLAAFGEGAWAMEQVLNLWLAEERPASDSLLALIDAAHARFAGWVDALQVDAAAAIDPAPVVAAAAALREGREQEATPAPEPVEEHRAVEASNTAVEAPIAVIEVPGEVVEAPSEAVEAPRDVVQAQFEPARSHRRRSPHRRSLDQPLAVRDLSFRGGRHRRRAERRRGRLGTAARAQRDRSGPAGHAFAQGQRGARAARRSTCDRRAARNLPVAPALAGARPRADGSRRLRAGARARARDAPPVRGRTRAAAGARCFRARACPGRTLGPASGARAAGRRRRRVARGTRRRPAAGLPRGGERPAAAHRGESAQLAGGPRRPFAAAAADARPAHRQGQRADGRRDDARPARARDGDAHRGGERAHRRAACADRRTGGRPRRGGRAVRGDSRSRNAGCPRRGVARGTG
ncbi:MAG: hypothetical protein DCC72_09785, partial [Burkholderiales bacterium]